MVIQRCCLILVFCAGLLAQAAVFAEPVTLNFRDADIHAVIATVSEVTGKNFIVDPRVNGKITIVSNYPMEKDEVYQVFLSALEVHGFATVPSGKVVKIVPDANAKFGGITTATDEAPGTGDEVITRVIDLTYVQAAQLVPILRPLASPQAHMAAYPQSNMLILSDRAGNTERLVKIIRRIDRPTTEELEVISLQHAAAKELAGILSTLEQQSKRADSSAKQAVILADERTNSILINAEPNDVLRLRTIISHLDTPLHESDGNIHVVYLRYAKAADLVPVLTGVAKTGKAPSAGGTPAAAAPAAGAPGPSPAPSTFGGSAASTTLNIQADESINALVITSTPEQFRALQSVIRQLDIRRAQVQVEAVIAEVSSDKAADLGIQWRFSGDSNITGTIGAATINSTSGISISPASTSAGLTLGSFKNGGFTLRALIRALSKDTGTNVLSTPTLMTLDNQEAEISVGQNVPFLTGTQQTTGGLANPFQTIERKDVGVKLKVKPQINEGDAVRLDIEQEVSSVSATSVTGASDIVTSKRSVKTSVLVDDGRIVVLGGLIKDDLTETVSKVPGLGDIPLIGKIFSTTNTTLVKTNLMVFLRPIIVRNIDDNTRLASDKYNYIRAKQLESGKDGVELMPREIAPKLPPLEEVQPKTPAVDPDAGTGTAKPWADPDTL